MVLISIIEQFFIREYLEFIRAKNDDEGGENGIPKSLTTSKTARMVTEPANIVMSKS